MWRRADVCHLTVTGNLDDHQRASSPKTWESRPLSPDTCHTKHETSNRPQPCCYVAASLPSQSSPGRGLLLPSIHPPQRVTNIAGFPHASLYRDIFRCIGPWPCLQRYNTHLDATPFKPSWTLGRYLACSPRTLIARTSDPSCGGKLVHSFACTSIPPCHIRVGPALQFRLFFLFFFHPLDPITAWHCCRRRHM